MNAKTILLVEDEQSIADALIFSLEQDNYGVNWCALGSDALTIIDSQKIDLVILDIGLPDINGFDLCKLIKAKQDLPIIFLTARQEEVDKLIGLEIGGDDYITKPFSLREVSSRIKVILKRYGRSGGSSAEGINAASLMGVENCTINNETLEIHYFNQALDLTRYEFLLFKTLIESPNRVFSRDILMQHVWDEPERSFERAVDTHIKTLRAKLKKINGQVQPIKTHHGLGYSFNDKEVFGMSIFIRLSLLYLALISCSIILVLNIFYDDIKPSIRQASEETLVDSANLMAEFSAPYLLSEQKNIEDIDKIFEAFKQRQLNATIWSHVKQKTNLNFYITDNKGQVVFHSSDKSQQGKDYSEWLDVSRTLAGEYGARTTRIEPDNDLTGSMYVAAPIMSGNTLIGVITLIQTHQGIQQFMGPAQTKILVVGGLLLLTLVILGLVLASWFNNMLKRLTIYVNKIRQGDAVEPLTLNDPSFNKLSDTLHQMRQDLDGKAYIEQYVHTLTHELKTPLSAISAAAQILATDLDAAQKQRFITNIETEVQRSKQLIERLLLLASIENQQHKIFKPIDFESLLDDEIQSFHSLLTTKKIRMELKKSEGFEGYVDGDEFLLRMAVRNLLDNAIDFSFENVALRVCLESSQSDIELRVINQGGVIPDYALPRLFERFFSTPRPSTGRKSSGLGLCLVNEIAHLHGGEVSLKNTLIPSNNNHLDSAVEAILIIAKEAKQP